MRGDLAVALITAKQCTTEAYTGALMTGFVLLLLWLWAHCATNTAPAEQLYSPYVGHSQHT